MFCCVEGEGQEVKDWLLGSALYGLLGVQAAAAYLLTWHLGGFSSPWGESTQRQADTHTHSRTHTSCSCTAAGSPGLSVLDRCWCGTQSYPQCHPSLGLCPLRNSAVSAAHVAAKVAAVCSAP